MLNEIPNKTRLWSLKYTKQYLLVKKFSRSHIQHTKENILLFASDLLNFQLIPKQLSKKTMFKVIKIERI